jgi:voltage-gated potassium channel
MAALAVAYLTVGLLADERGSFLPVIVIGAIFFVEFSVRLWAAPSRPVYLRKHWIDAVSCLPMIGGLRALRVLRILRVGTLMRPLLLAQKAATRGEDGRQSLGFVGPLLAVIWLGAAVTYWSLEHGVNPNVHSFGDALYWVLITTTTVGYGDVVPVTPEGHILAGALVFIGIGLLGFASGQITARLLAKRDDSSKVLEEVASLRSELHRMHELLIDRERRGEA